MKKCLYWDNNKKVCMLKTVEENKNTKCEVYNDCIYCRNKGAGRNGWEKTIMLEDSNIPLNELSKRMNLKFIFNDTIDGPSYQDLMAYMNTDLDSRKQNLVIWGENAGCGKTHWACKYAYYYLSNYMPEMDEVGKPKIYKDKPIQFVSVSSLIVRIKESWNVPDFELRKYIELLKEVPLVIWDDFIITGEYDKTTLNNLFAIIDSRISNNKNNVFTTNQNPNNWERLIGAPLSSRILGGAKVVHFRNKDLRKIDL